jgi:Polyketide cyclase / dehydrase and lipid transport
MIVLISLAVAAAIAAILILAAFKPDTFLIQRRATVKAAAGKVFPCINDFHNWASWSPFEKLDPNMTKTFSGAPSGKGAIYEWKGNNKAGAGRMEIVESSSPTKITIKLDFIKPFEGHNTCEFTMSPQGDSTEVTWAMHGPLPFMAKVMHVFVNMDKMLGKDFESGLASLKAIAET